MSVDFELSGHGTLYLLRPLTPSGATDIVNRAASLIPFTPPFSTQQIFGPVTP